MNSDIGRRAVVLDGGHAVVLRPARTEDIPGITSIYNEYVVDSPVSFDEAPWSEVERRRWLASKDPASGHQVWVAEVEGEVVATAWSGPWRDKAAYRYSVETTIVLRPGWTGRGLGRALYGTLLDALEAAGMHRAYAIVTLPNEASMRLHAALGYRLIGVLDEVGHKLGRWWSTALLERKLT